MKDKPKARGHQKKPDNIIPMNTPTEETPTPELSEGLPADGYPEGPIQITDATAEAAEAGIDRFTIENAPEAGVLPGGDAEQLEIPFREVTCSRRLLVPLAYEEREKLILRLVHIPGELVSVEEAKKAAANRYKADLDALKEEQAKTGAIIEDGGTLEEVTCEWKFRTSGFDGDGKLISHPEYKTLVRCDNGALVDVQPMTKLDYDHEEKPVAPPNDDLDRAPADEAPVEEAPGSEEETVTVAEAIAAGADIDTSK